MNHPQLALQVLASQHHASDYNRSKFGLHGSPVPYQPLSIHLPDHFNQLRTKQLINARHRAWWPAPSPDTRHALSLQDEIMTAIAEPLDLNHNSKPSLKNSISHPINISFIIPPDLVALISSHALLSPPFSPTLLEIPSSFTLDRLSNLRDARLQNPLLKPPPPATFSPLTTQLPSDYFRTRSNITHALHAAINGGINTSCHSRNTSGESKIAELRNGFLSGCTPEPGVSVAHSLKNITEPPVTDTVIPFQYFYSPPSFTIGNLFLSSCPGKKIRLDGPVKGRSGVCRDLETDMKRIKELGVGCIVCCLDDAELKFLGAPWPEYERSAQKIGVDILRLPIPEGLPPISPSCLDAHLVDVINRYSLRGLPILVHCRGGVGRAGVIACCWMIRLGLCGWLDQGVQLPPNTTNNDTHLDQDTITFAFVEKVIALVRRRRSIKAIETYEQVKFLVDYIDHLRNGSPPTLDQPRSCL